MPHDTLNLRPETAADHHAIAALTKAAFLGRPYADGDEQDVIDRLRARSALTLSLVAMAPEGMLGQITFSPATVDDGSGPWYALGPVSVAPTHQGQGIGSALIKAGLDQIDALGALGCILTGNPDYYQRFGFAVTPSLAPEREPGAFFMLRMAQGLASAAPPQGRFAFHPAFYG